MGQAFKKTLATTTREQSDNIPSNELFPRIEVKQIIP